MTEFHRCGRSRAVPLKPDTPELTLHATQRMALRGIRKDDLETVILCGREVHARGAVIHVIGRKEVEEYRRHGTDLSRLEGLHVICAPDGPVITAYRNRSVLAVKDRRHCHGKRQHWSLAA